MADPLGYSSVDPTGELRKGQLPKEALKETFVGVQSGIHKDEDGNTFKGDAAIFKRTDEYIAKHGCSDTFARSIDQVEDTMDRLAGSKIDRAAEVNMPELEKAHTALSAKL